MTLTTVKTMTLAEFLEWNPENGRYELIDGVPTEMQPKGKHEEIADFLETQFKLEVHRLQLPYRFPKRGLIKAPDKEGGYIPDILIIDRNQLINEPLWEQYSTLTQGTSIPLVIEVVSSNWRDDYGYKMADYESLGITEYWIIDYLGLGGKRFIGDPKQPTLTVCQLIEDEYQIQLFREDQPINSSIFPALNLTPTQIFEAEN